MGEAPPDLARALAQVPTRRMARRLFRCVPLLAFQRGSPPAFLYTSGRPGRCNPAGVACLYFAETEAAADAELRAMWRGTSAANQPKLTFQAKVRFRRIVDLDDAETLRQLGLGTADLVAPWRGRETTRVQALGEAISRQTGIAALRYPSVVRTKGRRSWNVAIFPDALVAPDRVEIVGDSDVPLEVLP